MVDKKKHQAGPVGYGMGAIPSPPDDRDFQLALTPEQLAATFPSTYVTPNPPPVINQGATPQCVAYSSSSMKAWQDRRDQGQWFNFNESLFFQQIGGTANGAVLRNAMARMLKYGYPVVVTGQASLHKIKVYYAASLAHESIKAALMAYGPIVFGTHWPQSWSSPSRTTGQVPSPSGTVNGHAILCIGWKDGTGFRFRNSWGTNWGLYGDCYIPARYLSTFDGSPLAAFEAWKTLDVIE